MSKIFINVLDKIVWMLLVTAITTQALQIAGVVEGPSTLGEITYPEESKEYEFKITSGESREKRQTQERLEVLDNIFNIPIATLNSVNELIQSTRRLRLQNLAIRQQEAAAQNQNPSSSGGDVDTVVVPRRRPYRRPRVGYTNVNINGNDRLNDDGSSSRVLLNVN